MSETNEFIASAANEFRESKAGDRYALRDNEPRNAVLFQLANLSMYLFSVDGLNFYRTCTKQEYGDWYYRGTFVGHADYTQRITNNPLDPDFNQTHLHGGQMLISNPIVGDLRSPFHFPAVGSYDSYYDIRADIGGYPIIEDPPTILTQNHKRVRRRYFTKHPITFEDLLTWDGYIDLQLSDLLTDKETYFRDRAIALYQSFPLSKGQLTANLVARRSVKYSLGIPTLGANQLLFHQPPPFKGDIGFNDVVNPFLNTLLPLNGGKIIHSSIQFLTPISDTDGGFGFGGGGFSFNWGIYSLGAYGIGIKFSGPLNTRIISYPTFARDPASLPAVGSSGLFNIPLGSAKTLDPFSTPGNHYVTFLPI